MFDILENKAPKNAEQMSVERLQKIKTSVLSQIVQDKPDKEERPMKKRTTFKALLVAAAVMTTGTVSVIGASAEINRTDPAVTVPSAQVEEVTSAASAIEETPDIPDVTEKPPIIETPETPEVPDTPAEPEAPENNTDSEVYKYVERVVNSEWRVKQKLNLGSKEKPEISNLTSAETEINGYKVTVINYEVDGKKMKMIRQSNDDMELLDIKEDGTRVCKTFSGLITSERSANGEYKGQGYYGKIYYDV